MANAGFLIETVRPKAAACKFLISAGAHICETLAHGSIRHYHQDLQLSFEELASCRRAGSKG
jgi:hypothetical protein